MKRNNTFILILLSIVVLIFWTGCDTKTADTPVFVVSNQPVKFIVDEITGSPSSSLCLLPSGTSEHIYSPKPNDVIATEKAKLIIYSSDVLDSWAVKSINPNKISLISLLPQDSLISGDDHHHNESSGNHHDITTDPHFWMDPVLVRLVSIKLLPYLIKANPKDSAKYRANLAKFITKLDSLDKTLNMILSPVQGRTFHLFHPSMLYLLKRYGLKYGGAIEEFPGKEPTINYLNELANRIKQSGSKAIFTEPQLSDKAIYPLKEMLNLPVLTLDPLGGVPGRMSYYELLIFNAQNLARAYQGDKSR